MLFWATYIAFSFDSEEKTIFKQIVKKNLATIYDNSVSWCPEDYFHLTMHFIGWINQYDAEKVKGVLDKFKTHISNISLNITGRIVLLGWENKKEYLVLEVVPTEELLALRDEIQYSLKDKGILVKEQPFLPHITLARVGKEIEHNNEPLFTSISIRPKKIALFESLPASKEL